jgi:hypothetical protein
MALPSPLLLKKTSKTTEKKLKKDLFMNATKLQKIYLFWTLLLTFFLLFHHFRSSKTSFNSEGAEKKILGSLSPEQISKVLLYQEQEKEQEQESSAKKQIQIYERKEAIWIAQSPYSFLRAEGKPLQSLWISPSHYQAVCEDSLQELLQILFPENSSFQGEIRSQDPRLHSLFQVTSASALHLVLQDSQGQNLAHLLLGKDDPLQQRTFLRELQHYGDTVFLAGPSLRQFLRVESPQSLLSPKTLLDLSLVSSEWLKKNKFQIHDITFSSPFGEYQVYLRKYFPPQMVQNQLISEEWFLKAPVSAKLKDSFSSVLQILSHYSAEDVAYPPTDLEKYQLIDPPFRLKISFKNEQEQSVPLEFGYRPLENQENWVGRRMDEAYAYQFSAFDMQHFFGSFGDFVAFERFGFPPSASQIEVYQGEEHYTLEKQGATWKSTPALLLPLQATKIQESLSALADLRPANLITKKENIPPLTQAYAVLRYVYQQQEYFIRVGPLRPGNPKERFIQVSTYPEIFTAKVEELEAILRPLSDFLDLRLFQASPHQALKIQVSYGGQNFLLERQGETTWKSTPQREIPFSDIRRFLAFFDPLKASKVLWDKSLSFPEKHYLLEVEYEKGERCEIALAPASQGQGWWILSQGFIFQISEEMGKILSFQGK